AFIVFEGPEGSGKTTQARAAAAELAARGVALTLTREPGGTAIGEQVRGVLLNSENRAMMPQTEALLLFAARAQHVREVIEPAAAEPDRWVVVDATRPVDEVTRDVLTILGPRLGLSLTSAAGAAAPAGAGSAT